MKLSELIEKIDVTKINPHSCPNFETIAEVFGISNYSDDYIRWESHVKEHYVAPWYCTDTWVGLSVIFLDGVPVATCWREGRKCDKNIVWISTDTYIAMKDFVLTFMVQKPETIHTVNLDEEFGETYKIDYNSQIIGDKAFYNGDLVTIKKWNWYDINGNSHLNKGPDPTCIKTQMDQVVVDLPNGERKIVEMKELDFPYNLGT